MKGFELLVIENHLIPLCVCVLSLAVRSGRQHVLLLYAIVVIRSKDGAVKMAMRANKANTWATMV